MIQFTVNNICLKYQYIWTKRNKRLNKWSVEMSFSQALNLGLGFILYFYIFHFSYLTTFNPIFNKNSAQIESLS